MKIIRFIELILKNFTSHRSQVVKYGKVTQLSGRNGQGKTSIGTAPVWILWGKDLLGNDYTKEKSSPRPSNYDYDQVFASILLSIDGKEYKFAREIDGKKNNFYVNDIPQTATEFTAAVAALIDQDEFMSLYFPAYFFGLHWTKQRAQMMKGVAAPISKDVLAEMSRTSPDQKVKKVKDITLNPQAAKLAELIKKQSIDDLEKIHRDKKPKLEKAHIAAESRTKTLKEQLERLPVAEGDLESLRKSAAALRAQIKTEDQIVVDADSTNAAYTALKARIQSLQEQVSASATGWPAIKDEPIDDTCKTCKRPLDEDAVEAVTADKEQRKTKYQENHKTLVAKRKEAEAALGELEWIDVSEQRKKVRELEDKLNEVLDAIRIHTDRTRLVADVLQAAGDEEATLASFKESTFILDAIKAYRAKEAELQADKVQALFTKLSIRLFKYVASRDEYEPDFSVQMDGKDYSSLSTGEKIEAGLELTEVLFKQSELVTPLFIDGIGEYTGKVAAYDQVITARAVPDQELKIETDGEIHND